jgi:hypothetical protein
MPTSSTGYKMTPHNWARLATLLFFWGAVTACARAVYLQPDKTKFWAVVLEIAAGLIWSIRTFYSYIKGED